MLAVKFIVVASILLCVGGFQLRTTTSLLSRNGFKLFKGSSSIRGKVDKQFDLAPIRTPRMVCSSLKATRDSSAPSKSQEGKEGTTGEAKENAEESEDEGGVDYEPMDVSLEYKQLLEKEGGSVKVSTLLQWDQIHDLIKNGFLDKEAVFEVASEVLSEGLETPISIATDSEAEKHPVSLEQFEDIVTEIDEMVFQGDDDDQVNEDDIDYNPEDEEAVRQARQELFNSLLKEGEETIAVSDLKNDERIQYFFKEGIIDEDLWTDILLSLEDDELAGDEEEEGGGEQGEEEKEEENEEREEREVLTRINFDQLNDLLEQIDYQQYQDEDDEEDDDEEDEEDRDDDDEDDEDEEGVGRGEEEDYEDDEEEDYDDEDDEGERRGDEGDEYDDDEEEEEEEEGADLLHGRNSAPARGRGRPQPRQRTRGRGGEEDDEREGEVDSKVIDIKALSNEQKKRGQ